MPEELCIRPLLENELIQLDNIAPPEWAANIATMFSFHYGQPYFHCIGALADGRVAGCANALLHGKCGWLGNIVVRPEWRGRGLGTALTSELMDFFKAKGVASQLLVATELGEPIYRKLGFKTTGYYVFLKNDQTAHLKTQRNIRPLETEDATQVYDIDREVTGEERSPFLQRFLTGGFVYAVRNTLEGFFLPGLANGLILALTERAGLALLKFKMERGGPTVVAPDGNQAALNLLKRSGYHEYARAPRMFYGENTAWKPECVFSRGSGFCG